MNMRRHRRPKHRGSHRRAPLTSRGPDLLAATWTLRLVLSAIRRPGDERVLVEEAAQLSGVQSVLDGMLVDRPRRRIIRNQTQGG